MTPVVRAVLRIPFVFLCFLAMISFWGCGDSKKLFSVSGTVTLDGAPFDSGTVLFSPVGDGRPGTAVIQPDGSYSLSTDGDEAGAYAGEYEVAVIPANRAGGEDDPPTGPKSPVPGRYLAPSTSGLRFTVEQGKDNRFDIQLQAGAR